MAPTPAPTGDRRASYAVTAHAVAAPISAATIRALNVGGIVVFVESLGVDSTDSEKLSEQMVDGEAMLRMTEDKLRSFGVRGGPAITIMRAIEPAVAEAQSVTLTVFSPTGKRKNIPYKITLTPDLFSRTFGPQSPLRVVNSGGVCLRVATSLAEAAKESSLGMSLHASRSYDDDLTSLLGSSANAAYALERATTRALALDASLAAELGQLVMVNKGESFTVSLRGGGKVLRQIEVDGLLVGARGAVLNSVKSTPTTDHAIDVVADARKLQGMLDSAEGTVTTNPAGVKEQLVGVLRIVPVLSGNYLASAVEDTCVEIGVSFMRPSGVGYAVTLVKVAEHS